MEKSHSFAVVSAFFIAFTAFTGCESPPRSVPSHVTSEDYQQTTQQASIHQEQLKEIVVRINQNIQTQTSITDDLDLLFGMLKQYLSTPGSQSDDLKWIDLPLEVQEIKGNRLIRYSARTDLTGTLESQWLLLQYVEGQTINCDILIRKEPLIALQTAFMGDHVLVAGPSKVFLGAVFVGAWEKGAQGYHPVDLHMSDEIATYFETSSNLLLSKNSPSDRWGVELQESTVVLTGEKFKKSWSFDPKSNTLR